MRLITWNINGLRSMKKHVDEMLRDFDGDIVALQETKISRNLLQEDSALVDGYTSYFSFPKKQSGYSGVATFCRNNCTPHNAQESLVSSITVCNSDGDETFTLSEELRSYDLQTLDSEGRVMITHHEIRHRDERKRLAVINVYCPRVDPEKPERHVFKMQFLHLLETKAHALLSKGCSVVIMGDMNIAHRVIDHCDPGNEEEYNVSEARQWLTCFLKVPVAVNEESSPSFVDVYRHLYPDQREAYTCWNTLTGARQTNYGTRIDYILVDCSLVPLIESCNILADVHGSDHCPVSLTLSCEAIPSTELPVICTRLWPEFSGKQQKLSNFYQRNTTTCVMNKSRQKSPMKTESCSKRSRLSSNTPKQKSITNFFKTNQVEKLKAMEMPVLYDGPETAQKYHKESDLDLQVEMQSGQILESVATWSKSKNQKEQSVVWRTVLSGPPKPPLCTGHKKPCVLRTVKKDGHNLGRQFFACAQPNGLASNPESRCDFFKWATPPRRGMLKNT